MFILHMGFNHLFNQVEAFSRKLNQYSPAITGLEQIKSPLGEVTTSQHDMQCTSIYLQIGTIHQIVNLLLPLGDIPMLALGSVGCGQTGQKSNAQAQDAGYFTVTGTSRARRRLGLLTPHDL